jgi:WS/DGAT/MGAT family acyltransferase
MPRYTYERLSYEDNSFLVMETPTMPMHVGATQIFRSGPLATAEGGIDVASIRRLTESVLHRVPRYRQKLAWIPGEDQAVWVDDAHFSLEYHMRHTSLPRPGTEAQLKQLAARVIERPLDRSRPLWETWVVEGLEGGRFAMINKLHHCMIDGVTGVDLSQILQSPVPRDEIGEPQRFIPRPLPSPAELRRDARRRLLTLPLRWLATLIEFGRTSDDALGEAGERLRALRGLLGWLVYGASETPLNGRLGPHRVFDWLTLSLEEVKSIRRALDCKVNDVVLTVVTGAVRDFMIRRQARPEDVDFRVSTPVNVRREGDRRRMGSRVSTWVVPLPLAEPDPVQQLRAIHETTRAARESHQELGTELVLSVLDGLPFAPSASITSRPVNTIVTNVPGPQFPLYLLGAEMLECFPQPPLLANMGLSIGLLSYNGRMCFGFNGDSDRVPDLGDFLRLMGRSFERLASAAGVVSSGVGTHVRPAPAPLPKPEEEDAPGRGPLGPRRMEPVRHRASAATQAEP